jgi:hypothetical protein
MPPALSLPITNIEVPKIKRKRGRPRKTENSANDEHITEPSAANLSDMSQQYSPISPRHELRKTMKSNKGALVTVNEQFLNHNDLGENQGTGLGSDEKLDEYHSPGQLPACKAMQYVVQSSSSHPVVISNAPRSPTQNSPDISANLETLSDHLYRQTTKYSPNRISTDSLENASKDRTSTVSKALPQKALKTQGEKFPKTRQEKLKVSCQMRLRKVC